MRQKLVDLALEWERTYGVLPAITCAVSELDAAILVGCSLSSDGRSAVTRGADFTDDRGRIAAGQRRTAHRGCQIKFSPTPEAGPSYLFPNYSPQPPLASWIFSLLEA